MKGAPKHFRIVGLFAALSSLFVAGCSDGPKSPLSPMDEGRLSAKSTAVSVKATDPAFGDQGQSNETVTITGSGFKAGAQVALLRNGQIDPTITVSSTQVVNSSTVVAVINIDPGSPVDFRDVQVTNFDRTQGIGAALFEVTQAQIIPGALMARGANDSGELTGQLTSGGVFYYNISTGYLQTVSTSGVTGYDISPAGNAIIGGGLNGAGTPSLFTRAGPVGTPWTTTVLPLGPTATGGAATAMVVDPATGQVTLAGGTETLPTVKGAACTNAVIWSWQASTGTWQRTVLPKTGGCSALIRARGLSANGTAVGSMNGIAVVWTPDGSGGYSITQLDAKYANGIDAAASIIVGETSIAHGSSTAVYWTASGSGWGSAITLPGGCISSRDIADVSHRLTLNDCPFGSGSVNYAAYLDPPYTTPIKLGGVGGHNNNFVGGISPSGQYMVGYNYTSGNVQVGVYWKP